MPTRMKRLLLCCSVLAWWPVPGARAQVPDPVVLYQRIDALYEHGDAASQERLLDSVLAASGRSNGLSKLARVFKARLMRNKGAARAALDILDTIVSDTAGTLPLIRYACMDERARVLKQLGRFPRAEIEAGDALAIARAHRLDRQEVAALILSAEIARKLGKVDVALAFLVQAEKLEERVGYPLARCNVIINRGNILYQQGRASEALARYREARECALAEGLQPLVMNAVFNEGSALSQMHEDSLAPAIAVYEKALADPYVKQDRRHEADLLGAIGMLRKFQGRYDLARAAIERSMAIRRSLDDTLNLAQELVDLATVFRKQGELDKALDAAQRGLVMSRSNRALENERDALREVDRILRELGRDREANAVMDDYILVDDTLEERESGERTVDMEYKYELEKKEGRIANAEARTRRRELQLIGSAVIAALLVLVLALVVRNVQHLRKRQSQTRELHEQQVNDLLKQQEIRSLDAMMQGQERERERVAKDLHDRLGTMLSTIRMRFSALQGRIEGIEVRQERQDDQAFGLLDEAVVEVRRISHDMVRGNLSRFGLTVALEDLCATLRFPGTMDVELGVFGLDQRLEGKLEIAVYRIVQEAVGNVLKHAKASELSIQVNRAPASLNVIVEDNGVGFDRARANEGMGMGNLRERAAVFGGVVSVDSRAGHGTTVTVDIPLTPASST
jgi:two-component system NarL family sensor kinase